MSMTKIIIYKMLDSLVGNHIGHVCCGSKCFHSLYIYFEPVNMNQSATGNIAFLLVSVRHLLI